MVLIDEDGLDIKFEKTKKSLGMSKQYKGGGPYRRDPIFRGIKKSLEENDYRQYLTRFRMNNLPNGITNELFFRILYHSGSAMFFYFEEIGRFLFLPYSMAQEDETVGIDFYGQFIKLRPYSFNGTTSTRGQTKENGKKSMADILLSTQIRENITDVPIVTDAEEAMRIYKKGAVICWDYAPGLAYDVRSRKETASDYVEFMVKVLVQTKSAMINSSGFNFYSSKNESANQVMEAQLEQYAKDREEGRLSAVVSELLGEIQNIQSSSAAAMTDFWAMYASVDNLRMKTMGISNDGVLQKSQYQNIQEISMDINDAQQIYWCSFMELVKFCAIANSIWGLDMYPTPLLMPDPTVQETEDDADIEKGEGSEKQAQEGTQDVD